MVFVDLAPIEHLWKSRQDLFQALASKAKGITGDGDFSLSIAETPYGAQVFSAAHMNFCLEKKTAEWTHLSELSVQSLEAFEGLVPFANPSATRRMIEQLQLMGFKKMKDLMALPMESLKARWGKLGELLWKRVRKKDLQPISPLKEDTLYSSYLYTPEGIASVPHLLIEIEKLLQGLFHRMGRDSQIPRKIHFDFEFEFSNQKLKVVLEPAEAHSDLRLYLKSLKQKLESQIDLNPVQQILIQAEVQPFCPKQLSLFDDPQTQDHDHLWNALFSSLRSLDFQFGFVATRSSFYPERQFFLSLLRPSSTGVHGEPGQPGESGQSCPATAWLAFVRPQKIFTKPIEIQLDPLARLRLAEKIDSYWWRSDRLVRDYYLLHSTQSGLSRQLWIFFDPHNQRHYQHGIFD